MVLDKSVLASDRQEEITMKEKVYSMYWEHDGENAPDVRPIDGDFDKVLPVGYEFNPVTNSVKIDDMPRLRKLSVYQGVPVDTRYMPTKALFKSNGYELPDIMRSRSRFIVSDRFRQVVEELEPGKHQFSAVELVDEAGMHVAEYFWFNPCARIDSVDREHTTHELIDVGLWDFNKGGKYIFNLLQIGDAQIWIDPRLNSGSVFIRQQMKEAMHATGLMGLGHGEFNAVRGL